MQPITTIGTHRKAPPLHGAHPNRSSGLASALALQFSRLDSVLQRTTLEWPSGHPSNSAIRLKPAFSYISGA